MGGNVNFNPSVNTTKNDTTKVSLKNIAQAGLTGAIAGAMKALASTQQPVDAQNTPREFTMFSGKEPDYSGEVSVPVTSTYYENGEVAGQNTIEIEVPYSTEEAQKPEENVYILDMRPDGKPVFMYQTADAYEIPDGVSAKEVYNAVRDFNKIDKGLIPYKTVALPEVLTVTKDGQTFEIRRKEMFEIKGNDIKRLDYSPKTKD